MAYLRGDTYAFSDGRHFFIQRDKNSVVIPMDDLKTIAQGYATRHPDQIASTFNINSRVRVTLTPHGRALLEQELKAYSRSDMVIEPVWETQLWEFMSLLGRHFFIGNKQIVKDNLIEIIPSH